MPTALVIHGHFYQPPRENPWTEMVEREPSAYPHHDWNERIYLECYRANAYARIFDRNGRVERIVNNYRHLSFNFGPTLLTWLERRHPATYRRIVESGENAIAQGYNHAILPLCSERDRRTQIRWGLADFRYRFGREAESLWLPETACNDDVLGALIDEGLKFVILSPHQAERVRRVGETEWKNVGDGTIDPGVAYRYSHRDGSGRSLAIFFYDGPIAQAIAFEGALVSSTTLLDRLSRAQGGDGRIIHVATDGESYGHHTRHAERCLAYAFEREAERRGFWVTNYSEYLKQYPPQGEVEIKGGEGTAWSCAHGVGRWYRDCGCSAGAREGWNQAWRQPLRQALDLLRDRVAAHFEASGLFQDPWRTRDAYVELILDRSRSSEEFLNRHSGRRLRESEQLRAMSFLELQRNALLMYTSCGWFFADISGLEAVQVLKYAGRVLDLADELDLESPADEFLQILSQAKSNLPEMGNGADVFRRFVEPSRVSTEGIAAHLALSSLVERSEPEGDVAGYYFRRKDYQRQAHGRIALATGRVILDQVATGRQFDGAFSALHFGGVDFYCVLKPFPGIHRFNESARRIWRFFRTAALPTMLRIMREEFGPEEFGLEHVLSEGRQRIAEIVFGDLVMRFSEQYARLYEDNRRIIEMLRTAGFQLPAELRAAAEFTLGKRFEEEMSRANYARAQEIAEEISTHGYRIDRVISGRNLGDTITAAVRKAVGEAIPENVEAASALLRLVRKLGIDADIDRAQEALFESEDGELLRGLAPLLNVSLRAREPARTT